MKLNCETTDKYLSEYIDGTIAGDIAWKIEMHVATCPECASLVRTMRQTVGMLNQLQPRELSSNFDSKLAEKIAQIQAGQAIAKPGSIKRFIDGLSIQIQASRHNAKLRIGIAAAAFSLAGLGILIPYVLQPGTTINQAVPLVISSSSPDDHADLAFVAACANEQNQSTESSTILDPTAQTLAARFDESVASSMSANASPSPAQD